MVGCCVKSFFAVFCLTVMLSVFFWLRQDKIWEAKCVFAYWKNNVVTNESGEVVQPVSEMRLGTYTDYRRVAEESLCGFMSRKGTRRLLLLEYLKTCGGLQLDAIAVSNAFESVRFTISGDVAAIVELSAESNSRSLSLDVVRITLARYIDYVEETNLAREEKALAVLKDAIKKKTRNGENVSDLAARLDAAKVSVGEYRPRITVLKLPFIVSGLQ